MEGLSTVTWNARTFYARSALAAGQPSSSVTRLIQGIWETETAQARAILRKRIHTTEQLTRGSAPIAELRRAVADHRPSVQRSRARHPAAGRTAPVLPIC